MRSLTAFGLAIVAALAACSGSEQASPACTDANWTTCETPPSLDNRSVPWPEQRTELARLADATEYAIANPRSWWSELVKVKEPFPPLDVFSDQPRYARASDLGLRHYPIRDARIHLEDARSGYLNLVQQQAVRDASGTSLPASAAAIDAQLAADARARAEGAWAEIHRVELFRDPFGQPEPRKALLVYALIATQTQLMAEDPVARRARASEAASFLESRIREWEQMQRARLTGRPEAELREAFDAFGTPELRRLIQAWMGIESLQLPSAS